MTIQSLLYRIARISRLVPVLLLSATCAMAADDHTAQKYKFNLPPSAELEYDVVAKQSGFSLDGKAHVVDPPHSIDDRQVREDHLGTDRKLEGAHGFVISLALTSMNAP